MKKATTYICAALALAMIFSVARCLDKAKSSKVYQGVCLTVGEGGKSLTLANSQPKLNPIKGASATFDISKAKVGLSVEKGNVVRLAYVKQGAKLVALKVMNVSKQDLRKK